jgi:hypothetical protein
MLLKVPGIEILCIDRMPLDAHVVSGDEVEKAAAV